MPWGHGRGREAGGRAHVARGAAGSRETQGERLPHRGAAEVQRRGEAGGEEVGAAAGEEGQELNDRCTKEFD